eukprot:Nk52_evm23s1178 gene=Nk52_evmTU23s1178
MNSEGIEKIENGEVEGSASVEMKPISPMKATELNFLSNNKQDLSVARKKSAHVGVKVNIPVEEEFEADIHVDGKEGRNSSRQHGRRLSDHFHVHFNSHEEDRAAWLKGSLSNNPAPGAYEQKDYLNELLKSHNTYGFKGTGRNALAEIGYHDKDFETEPGLYDVVDYENNSKDLKPSAVFRSSVPRSGPMKAVFQTPGVGAYNLTTFQTHWSDPKEKKRRVLNSKLCRLRAMGRTHDISPEEREKILNIEKKLNRECSAVFKAGMKQTRAGHRFEKDRNMGPGIYMKNDTVHEELCRKYGIFYPTS